jgi:hypothetical protein
MTDQQSGNLAFSTILRRAPVILTALLGLVLLYLEGATAYTNTQEAIKAKAVADNAAVKQHAEAILLQGQAKIAFETARNAAPRVKAEAETTEAEADKIGAEALTLKEKAGVADRKARADALTIVAEARKRRAQLIAGNAELRNVARKEKAEVERLEAATVLVWNAQHNN